MWCSREGFVTEVRQMGEHDWRLRDGLRPVPDFTWKQKALHFAEDCLESIAKAATETAKVIKKVAQNSWMKNLPAIGVKLAGISLAALVIVTNVSERLGG